MMPQLGKKHSEQSKRKLSLAARLYWRKRRYRESLKGKKGNNEENEEGKESKAGEAAAKAEEAGLGVRQ